MDPQIAELEARIVELEIRYTHQEALVETLSDLVRAQHDAIERLRRALGALEGRLDDAFEGAPSPPDPFGAG